MLKTITQKVMLRRALFNVLTLIDLFLHLLRLANATY